MGRRGTPKIKITQLGMQLAENLEKISDLAPGLSASFNELSLIVYHSPYVFLTCTLGFYFREPNPSHSFLVCIIDNIYHHLVQ